MKCQTNINHSIQPPPTTTECILLSLTPLFCTSYHSPPHRILLFQSLLRSPQLRIKVTIPCPGAKSHADFEKLLTSGYHPPYLNPPSACPRHRCQSQHFHDVEQMSTGSASAVAGPSAPGSATPRRSSPRAAPRRCRGDRGETVFCPTLEHDSQPSFLSHRICNTKQPIVSNLGVPW